MLFEFRELGKRLLGAKMVPSSSIGLRILLECCQTSFATAPDIVEHL